MLNHLIREELPANALGAGQGLISNSDPVTGQAGWYDVRVRIDRAEAPSDTDEPSPDLAEQSWPQFAPPAALPQPAPHAPHLIVLRYFAGRSSRQGKQP